jgi:branched-chain amino acid transport system permease protein
MKLDKKRPFRLVVYIVIGLLVIAVPVWGDVSILGLVSRIFLMGLLAMSLDFLVGYTGLWSFGHAAFFAIGSYTTGILILRCGITDFWLTTLAGILMAALAAAIFGVIALRASGIYFLLVTFALGELIYAVGVKWVSVTGGTYGLPGIPLPNFADSPTSFYYLILVVVIICSILLYFITKSPFGYSLQGIRGKESRMKVLGYNTWLHKYIAYIIAGLFAGVAGTMYGRLNGIAIPDDAGATMSGILWLMITVGGIGTLWGAFIGSGVILLLQYFVSGFLPQRWPLMLGFCLIIAVFVTRKGIWRPLNNLLSRM